MNIKFELTKKIRLKIENYKSEYVTLYHYRGVFTIHILFLMIHFLYSKDEERERLTKGQLTK